MIHHKSPISGVAAYERRYVATAGYDNQVILWDAATRKSIARGCHDHLANQVRFSPCGRYLFSAGSDRTARIWEIPSMRLINVLAGHEDDVEAIACHPTQEFLATVSRDYRARVFSFSGQLVATMTGHVADAISVEWTSDGKEIITSSDDGTVKRWNAFSGELLADFDLGGIETDTLVVSANGTIFAGNDDGQIVVMHEGHSLYVPAHSSGIKRLIYDSKSKRLVSLSYDRKVRIWEYNNESLLLSKESDLPIEVWPRSVAFLGESELALATFGSSFAVFDLESGSWDMRAVQPTFGVNAVVSWREAIYTIGDAGRLWRDGKPVSDVPSPCNFLCPFKDILLTGGQSGQIFDALNGQIIYQHHSPLNCAAIYDNNNTLYAFIGTYSGEAIVLGFDGQGKVVVVNCHKLQSNAIKGLAIANHMLCSVGASGEFVTHSLPDLIPVHHIASGHDKIANGCTSLGDGRFASISRDLKLRIWLDGVAVTLATPHEFSIKCIAADPTGDVIATGSYGGILALYQISAAKWVTVERATTAGISCITYDNVCNSFVASSYDGHLYKLPITLSSRIEVI